MKKFITDLLGAKIEIVDYDEALKQACLMASCRGKTLMAPGVSAEEYWRDLRDKIIALKRKDV